MSTSLKTRFKRIAARLSATRPSGEAPDTDALSYKIKNWILTAPRVTSTFALAAVLVTLIILAVHIRAVGLTLFTPEEVGTSFAFEYLRSFYFLGLALLAPVLLLAFIRYRVCNIVIPVSIASAAVFIVWVASEIVLSKTSGYLYYSGVEPAKLPEILRLLLTTGLILSPPVLAVLYKRCPLMDRYLLRQFLGPFALCSIAIIAILVIIDLSDNGPNFIDAKASLGTVFHYYVVQLPQMIIIILPATLLLGLLYALGKMSKSNELVSMLSSGKSLLRIISPLIFVGGYCSLLCLSLNYEWAPQATAQKAAILRDINEQSKANNGSKKKKKKKAVVKKRDLALARNQMYEHVGADGARRLWSIRYIPLDLSQKKMQWLEIVQRNEEGELLKTIYAEKAAWNHATGDWHLKKTGKNQVKIFDYTNLDDKGLPEESLVGEHVVSGWDETPWNIVSEHLVADHLGVPDLGFHLEANSEKSAKKLAPFRAHWHYRWAAPWSCLAVVLFAAPLGIGLSRRGVIGGALGAIALFVLLLLLLTRFLLVLGQSQHLPPLVAAWSTYAIVLAIGAYLIYMRSMNKDLPKLSLRASMFSFGLFGKMAVERADQEDEMEREQKRQQEALERKRARIHQQQMAEIGENAEPGADLAETDPDSGRTRRRRRQRQTTATTSTRRRSEFDLDFE